MKKPRIKRGFWGDGELLFAGAAASGTLTAGAKKPAGYHARAATFVAFGSAAETGAKQVTGAEQAAVFCAIDGCTLVAVAVVQVARFAAAIAFVINIAWHIVSPPLRNFEWGVMELVHWYSPLSMVYAQAIAQE